MIQFIEFFWQFSNIGYKQIHYYGKSVRLNLFW